jgi:hypothetical protein
VRTERQGGAVAEQELSVGREGVGRTAKDEADRAAGVVTDL